MFFKKQKYIKNMVVMLVLMFALGFSINVHAEEPVDNNDFSNEVVPALKKWHDGVIQIVHMRH